MAVEISEREHGFTLCPRCQPVNRGLFTRDLQLRSAKGSLPLSWLVHLANRLFAACVAKINGQPEQPLTVSLITTRMKSQSAVRFHTNRRDAR
jgi:hypothetical protein